MGRQVSLVGMKHITVALFLIEKLSPRWFRHFESLKLGYLVDPDHCGSGAAACSWSPKYGPGTIVFAVDPGSLSPVEVARILRHESHHYSPVGDGTFIKLDHKCSDRLCSDPIERARDEIYRADDHFVPEYTRLWAVLEPKLSPQPSFLETAGKVVLGGVVAAGVIALTGSVLGALFGKGDE